MMQVACPSCGGVIQSDDMNLANMAGKCRACNALVNLRDYLPETAPPARPPAPRPRGQVPRPPGFVVEDSGSALTISRRWFSCAFVGLALFCVAWDSFLVFWYSMAFATGAPWIFKVFPVIHLAVGVGMTYFTLAGFLNRTTIRVEDEALTVHHGPLPWPGNCRLPVEELKQVYCQQETNRGRNGVSYTYKVNAVMKDGSKRTLLSNLSEQDQALFVEQQLERYLGIQDRPVPGEMRR